MLKTFIVPKVRLGYFQLVVLILFFVLSFSSVMGFAETTANNDTNINNISYTQFKEKVKLFYNNNEHKIIEIKHKFSNLFNKFSQTNNSQINTGGGYNIFIL